MRRIRKHLSFSNGVALLALFIALGGASYAAIHLPKNSVGRKQLKKNAVVSSKVRNHSLLSKDFKSGQLPKGDKGDPGTPGTNGTNGTNGTFGAITVQRTDVALAAGPSAGNAGAAASGFTACPAGTKIVGGSVNVGDPTTAVATISRPATDNTGSGGIPSDGDGFAFWKGTAHTTTNVVGTLRVFAICADAPTPAP